MRISVNLATRPFVELRPLFARLRIAMVALGVLAIGLVLGLGAMRRKAEASTAQMSTLTAETTSYQNEKASNEARMRQPQNQSVLQRSQFLNALFARKSFSWTAVMMDLERVLPPGVQVTSIEPIISKEGDVTIRLRVTGDRNRAIQLVRNLETSQRFVAPRLGGESSLSAEKANAIGRPGGGVQMVSATGAEAFGNGVEFEIFSGYNPLPTRALRSAEKKAKTVAPDADTSTSEAQPAVRHQRKPAAPAGGAR